MTYCTEHAESPNRVVHAPIGDMPKQGHKKEHEDATSIEGYPKHKLVAE